MSRRRRIRYAIDADTGCVVSRVFDEFAFEVIDFEAMKPENSFGITTNLERFTLEAVLHARTALRWTRKIPVELKNRHRRFWKMPELKKPVAA